MTIDHYYLNLLEYYCVTTLLTVAMQNPTLRVKHKYLNGHKKRKSIISGLSKKVAMDHLLASIPYSLHALTLILYVCVLVCVGGAVKIAKKPLKYIVIPSKCRCTKQVTSFFLV